MVSDIYFWWKQCLNIPHLIFFHYYKNAQIQHPTYDLKMFRNNENIFLLLFKKQSVHNTGKVLAINKEEPDSSATAGEG